MSESLAWLLNTADGGDQKVLFCRWAKLRALTMAMGVVAAASLHLKEDHGTCLANVFGASALNLVFVVSRLFVEARSRHAMDFLLEVPMDDALTQLLNQVPQLSDRQLDRLFCRLNAERLARQEEKEAPKDEAVPWQGVTA